MWRQRPNLARLVPEEPPICKGEYGPPPAALSEAFEHCVHLAHTRTARELAPSILRVNGGEEFFSTQRGSAAELCVLAHVHERRHSTDVVVMPVGCDDQADSILRLDADCLKVFQGLRFPCIVDAGVHDNPPAVTDVYDDTLAVPWSEQGNFDLVFARAVAYLSGVDHSSKDARIFFAHAFPACASLLLIAGRSRNTRNETRSF